MAVRVSTAPLAGAVAAAGGIGVIGATGMEEQELRDEIREARRIAPNGIIGINIMYAAKEFSKIVHTAMEEKIDMIFTGAGFSGISLAGEKHAIHQLYPLFLSKGDKIG